MAGLDSAVESAAIPGGDESIQSELEQHDDIDQSARSSGQEKKEMLMRMIAQEMVSSLLGDTEVEGLDDDDEILKNLQDKLIAREKARKATFISKSN